MKYGLENKVVVITGASRGLGRELAIGFAKENAKVVINYLNSEDCAKELLKEIESYNDNCMIIRADVTNSNDVRNMYQTVIRIYGKVDVLINNAGITSDHFVNIMNATQWNNVINTNLTSVFLCSRCFSKSMIKSNSGKIVNISSIKGQLGSEGQSNYAASKAGVIAFTKSMAKELGKKGISVNAICPGFIVTDLNYKSTSKKEIAKRMSAMSLENGLIDFVNFTLFIASDNMQGVSGQVFNIDSRIMS